MEGCAEGESRGEGSITIEERVVEFGGRDNFRRRKRFAIGIEVQDFEFVVRRLFRSSGHRAITIREL